MFMRRGVFALTAAACAMLASPAEAAWRRAESPNFIVYSQSGEQKLKEQVELLEDFHGFVKLLTRITEAPAPNKLSVYIVRNHAALKSVAPEIPDPVDGFYTATANGLGAFIDAGSAGGRDAANEILFHEITHYLMLQYRPTAYPPWYVEGFAEYMMTASFDKERIDVGKPSPGRAYTLGSMKWLPLDAVLFGGVPKARDEGALYYGEAWLLVHYLMRDPARKAQLVDYLRATAGGEAPRAAFKRIFAVEPKQLQADLDRYAHRGMTYSQFTRRTVPAPAQIVFSTLPDSADDLLLAKARLDLGIRAPADRAAVLAQVRQAAAKYPDDPFARRVLAEAEALYGDGAAADRLLDALLAASPKDGELLYLKGMRYLAAARANETDDTLRRSQKKQAAAWFVRAHDAAPYHFQSLVRYVESLSGTPAYNSENSLNILLLAHDLAPQVSDVTMNASTMLIRRGRYDEAIALLGPLASNPHDERLAAAARALLNEAREKGKAKPPEGA
jgi:Flp pilus assembly protein TadD